MKMLANILIKFCSANKGNFNKDNRACYIIYKIVDRIPANNLFVLQYINTKAIFYLHLSDIVFDSDILYSLHPIQACYIGIEYAKSIKTTPVPQNKEAEQKLNKQSIYRYGKYTLLFQNREKKICFFDSLTNKELIMAPVDIAISQELIQEFDAAQAFHIGFLAGLEISNKHKKINKTSKTHAPPKLKLIINNKNNVG